MHFTGPNRSERRDLWRRRAIPAMATAHVSRLDDGERPCRTIIVGGSPGAARLLSIFICCGSLACARSSAPAASRDTVFVAGTKIGVARAAGGERRRVDDARPATTRAPATASSRRSRRHNAANLKVVVDVLHRRAARPRGTAARRRQHDVPRDAVPERRVRDRSHAAGPSAASGSSARRTRRRRWASRAATS